MVRISDLYMHREICLYKYIMPLPGEVPEDNGACYYKLLAGEDEFRRPQQTNEMNPPEVAGDTF